MLTLQTQELSVWGNHISLANRLKNLSSWIYINTDTFICPILAADGLRLARLEEITAMKIDVIARSGRKKDFWDIHELLEKFSIEQMLELHMERYPYVHNRQEILQNLIRFESADGDFDPICMKNKHWELIKLDISESIQSIIG